MFYFLYKSGRHASNERYRFKQTTRRGDFNQEMLYRCLRNKYEILNFGSHEAQQLLEKVGMIESFYGHIVKIEDPKSAVWAKLNHEQVGKNGTSYVGAWKEIDVDFLRGKVEESERVQKDLSSHMTQMNSIRSFSYSVDSAVRTLNAYHTHIAESLQSLSYAECLEVVKNYKEIFANQNKILEDRYTTLSKRNNEIKAEIQAHLDEKKY